MGSRIEWLHRPGTKPEVWNPVTGCTKVSEGCRNCYAERQAERFWPTQYPAEGRAFADVWTHPDRLDAPLRWKSPRTVFVNSMSDLFHEAVPNAFIDRAFAVMALCPQHTFIVLTKRPERMREYSVRLWPNVWLGVSVEDQRTADQRIPLLLDTPAAVRVVSAEPLLGPVDLNRDTNGYEWLRGLLMTLGGAARHVWLPPLDWLIVGGESGPQARPCDVAWVRSLVRQTKAAGVPVFVKQLGANVLDRNDAGFEGDSGPQGWPVDTKTHDVVARRCQGDPVRVCLRDRKGGDPSEWPEDLRVREWPSQEQP